MTSTNEHTTEATTLGAFGSTFPGGIVQLSIEAFFPADAATAARLRALAAA